MLKYRVVGSASCPSHLPKGNKVDKDRFISCIFMYISVYMLLFDFINKKVLKVGIQANG